ncbi:MULTISPECIES: hypothetical protein [Pseudidiomarina]|uniref:Replication-associated protein ORF2/G2P domain-containing protein n=2 Tax=Pseudidiomarina TaxID=2800384 RepID=A0A368USF0_9GAMM|nr:MULTISPECIES: hypothetical protein [Pseudidiomarina]PWW08877.1 hypothetical protein DET45_12223 [Pseudidiomarina maritima]RBP90147.1 hypothetical protein DFO81_10810 [Pseudidiomarina tainanensis]RCW31739.1 hypothetical protein DFO79_10888 [Pseudidiomarina tainanensis]
MNRYGLKLSKIASALAKEYFTDYKWFITLTYKHDVRTVERVRRDLKTLAKHLRERAYGKHSAKYFKSSNHIMMVGGIERHADDRIHIHLVLTKPPAEAKKAELYENLSANTDEFLIDYWEQVKNNSYQNKPEDLMDSSDQRSSLEYCLKYTDKHNANFFIMHWDSPKFVSPIECKR